jgi:hypothetical protein
MSCVLPIETVSAENQKTLLAEQGFCWFCSRGGLDHDDLGSLQAFGAFLDGKLYLLAFFKGTVTFPRDAGIMDEHIRSIFARQETIAFGVVEPLYRSDNSIRHSSKSPFFFRSAIDWDTVFF